MAYKVINSLVQKPPNDLYKESFQKSKAGNRIDDIIRNQKSINNFNFALKQNMRQLYI